LYVVDDIGIERHDEAGWTVLVVSGQVDVATAPRLRQALTEAQYGGEHRVALDLDGVEFLDSFGLGVLVGGCKRAGTHGGELVIVCSRSRLMHLFEVTRLQEIVPVVPSLAEYGAASSADPR
jgi:anti-sigma B factor antagonist